MHFRRYLAEDPEDVEIFQNVLLTFWDRLPLPEFEVYDGLGVLLRAICRLRGSSERVAGANSCPRTQERRRITRA